MIPDPIRPMTLESFRVGRFLVSRLRGNRGDHHVLRINKPFTAEQANYRSMLVSGRMTRVHGPEGWAPREYVAGQTNLSAPAYTTPGVYISECQADSTLLICVQAISSFARIGYSFIQDQNTSIVVPKGGVFVLGKGSISAAGEVYKAGVKGRDIIHVQSDSVEFTLHATTGIAAWFYSTP